MGFLEDNDIRELLKDPELMADVAKAMVEDPKAMDGLAEDIAVKLSGEIEADLELKSEIVQAAMANPGFKAKLIKKLVEEFDD